MSSNYGDGVWYLVGGWILWWVLERVSADYKHTKIGWHINEFLSVGPGMWAVTLFYCVVVPVGILMGLVNWTFGMCLPIMPHSSCS